MSKYNRIESIPIEQIPKNEIKQAIKEWAEGNIELEKLLTNLYERNIKTSGCHVGPDSYIDFFIDNHQKEIENMLSVLKSQNNWDILISPDGGNPFSGPDFYKASLSIGFNVETEKELSCVLNKVNATFNESFKLNKDNLFNSVIELHDLFKEKKTGIHIRIENKQNRYIINIEDINYFKSIPGSNIVELLNKLEMKKSKYMPEHEYWFYATDNFDKFENKVLEIKNTLKKELIINEATEIKDNMSFNLKATVNRKNMTEEEFKNWLKEEKKKRFKEPENKLVLLIDKIRYFKRKIFRKLGIYDRQRKNWEIKINKEIDNYIKNHKNERKI